MSLENKLKKKENNEKVENRKYLSYLKATSEIYFPGLIDYLLISFFSINSNNKYYLNNYKNLRKYNL